VSVINEKQVILGEDLEPKESLTVDGSTGKSSKGRLAVYKIIWYHTTKMKMKRLAVDSLIRGQEKKLRNQQK